MLMSRTARNSKIWGVYEIDPYQNTTRALRPLFLSRA